MIQLLLNILRIKAATRDFYFSLILAAPVDQSGMSTMVSCRKDLDPKMGELNYNVRGRRTQIP